MDKQRKKLIALIKYCTSCEECRDEDIADHLIANGVTVQDATDNNVAYKLKATELPRDFGRWIPVEERKPDVVISSVTGKGYSEAVNVLTSGRNVITAIYNGEDFIGDAEFWEAEDEAITHWTPVLLPLPIEEVSTDA